MDQQKLSRKKQALIERTALALGVDYDAATELLHIGRSQSIRINPLAIDQETAISKLRNIGWTGQSYNWFKNGLTIDTGLAEIKDSPMVVDGQLYLQNAASWLPVIALDVQKGERVLDVCAAPGGKTSHIAAEAENKAYITANDNSRPRLAKLRANLTRLSVRNVDYALYEASQLSYKLAGMEFDRILLDAPCSGEGMMTLGNDKDFQYWSVAHIKRLQQLQKKIIAQSWRLLKPGGTLVYSTCTMAPEENEAVIDYLLRHNEDASVIPLTELRAALPNVSSSVLNWNNKQYSSGVADALRLHPSQNIEAFFVCKLVKEA